MTTALLLDFVIWGVWAYIVYRNLKTWGKFARFFAALALGFALMWGTMMALAVVGIALSR